MKQEKWLNIKSNHNMYYLIKFNDVVCSLYLPHKRTLTVIIEAVGAPCWGDSGKHMGWKACNAAGVALLVPDYLGSGRSGEEIFSMKNCLETIKRTELFAIGNTLGTDVTTGERVACAFSKVILVGTSVGGAVIPFYHEYYPSSGVKGLGFLYPTTTWDLHVGQQYKEESDAEYLSLLNRGWSAYYRGFKKSDWQNIIKAKNDRWNPMKNMVGPSGMLIFVCHGNKDVLVSWRRSYAYYERLKEKDPTNRYIYWELLQNAAHGGYAEYLGYRALIERFNLTGYRACKLQSTC